MSWRPRRTKRAIRRVILLVVAAGAVALLPASTWRDAQETARRHSNLVEDLVRPIAARSAEWIDRRTQALSNLISRVYDKFRASGKPKDEEPRVRIVPGPATLSGAARVVDGDTLVLGSVRIRLHGIDAPESTQNCQAGGRFWACGREATWALARLVRGKPVSCEERDWDRYGRAVAVCGIAGQDLNAWMVAEGWAFAYRRYSRAYVAEEARAQAAKRGIWRGEVVAPWDWRRGKRLTGSRPAIQRDNRRCDVKGNISKSGKRIYHVPGGRYYDRTRINTSRGERWFCTETEARAAGWRRSRQ